VTIPDTGQTVLVLPTEPLVGSQGYAQIVRADGAIIRPPGSKVNVPVTRRVLKVAAGKEDPFFEDVEVDGVHTRVLTGRLENGDAVQAARSLANVDRTLRRLAFALVLIALGGIAVAVWLGRVVARAALRPVSDLTYAAEEVARTRDLGRRMRAGGSDELSRLGASFNTMLEALQDSQRAQRQLVADASHELRTPLTSLRTNIEVLAQVDSLSPEDRERLLADLLAQLDELTVLVTDLVDLARGDDQAPVAEDVRLDLLVRDAVESARRHASGQNFAAELQPCFVRGVPGRLDRAVSNMLDNAVKWSPPEGRITVRVECAEGRSGDHQRPRPLAEVSVRDQGPGIAEDDLPFVFDRFYRAPSARGLPGSGLGLAIVRQVAEAHAGEVSAERPPEGGALLRLRLPRLADEPQSGDGQADEPESGLWAAPRSL
jgi:two-component system sensor histidine kinase MprB